MGQHVSNVVGSDLETHGNSLRPVSASPAFKLWINIITGKDLQFGQSAIGQSDPVLSLSNLPQKFMGPPCTVGYIGYCTILKDSTL